MTISQLLTEFWIRAGLPEDNEFLPVSEVTAFMNEGYRDFVSETRCHRKFVLIDIVADTQSYDLPNDSFQPLWFGFRNQQLIPVSTQDLDRQDERWVGQHSGTPLQVTVGLDGINKFYLYYPPSVSSTPLGNSTDGLIEFESWIKNVLLFYISEIADDLTSDQTPDLETIFQWAIVYYALWKAFEKEGDFQELDIADFWKARYYQKIAEKKTFTSEVQKVTAGDGYVKNLEFPNEENPWGPYFRIIDRIEWEWTDKSEIVIDDDGSLIFGRQNKDGSWPSGALRITRLELDDNQVGHDLIFYIYDNTWIETMRITA